MNMLVLTFLSILVINVNSRFLVMMNKGFGSTKKFGIPEFAYSGKVKPGVLSPKSIVPDHIGIIIAIIIKN